jgi:glycosyltransferase involved in cell wall biosynthesis
MYKGQKLTLIFPCRNEAEGIQKLISSVPKEVDEIIVVDNCSTDKTVARARKAGAKVFIEERTDNGIGYGFALTTGINKATGDIVICMDADGSYPIHKILDAVKFQQKNKVDFVSCNRLPILNVKEMAVIRRLGVWILNTTVRLLYGYPIQDSLTGMWVFNRKAIQNFQLFEGGWNLSLEIKLHAIHDKNTSFTEFHIPYRDRIFDQSKQNLFETGFTHFVYLLTKRVELYNISVLRSPKVSLVQN